MNEWISVESKLPEPDIDVLTWVANFENGIFQEGERYAAIDCFCTWTDGATSSFKTDRFYKAKVTHWMTLPEPPKH